MFAGGLWIYLRTTTAKDRIGRLALAGLVTFLVLLYLTVLFGPTPTDWRGLAYSSFFGLLLPLWAWWADRHRALRS